MTEKPTRSLYLCYFGVREPLVQNQVLPYLRELVRDGVEVSLLTFEPKARWSGEEVRAQKEKLAAEGISWDFRKYHKRFSVLSTTYDILVGAIYARSHVARHGTDILHARVHMPAAMGVIAKKLSLGKRPKVLFDIRGFLPEEYTDAGVWKENGFVYRAVKRVEKWLLRNCDGFVVLTDAARDVLFPESADSGLDAYGRPVAVIPCCVDHSRFGIPSKEERIRMRSQIGADDRPVVVYIGSGGWYLTAETENFYRVLKTVKPNSFALVLTQGKTEKIDEMLARAGFGEKDRLVSSASPDGLPAFLGAADFAVSFIKPCYSRQASSPTKNAEYLACGLPIVVNDGIGDTSNHLREDGTGVVLDDFSDGSIERGLKELDAMLAEGDVLARRCRESSQMRFSLADVGGERYRDIYRRLTEGEEK